MLRSKAARPTNLTAAYWLIEKHETSQPEVLTVDLEGGKEALPVFSFEEEARLFLHLKELGKGWRISEATAGEIISVLFGQCANAGWVALDPIPEIDGEALVGILSLRRENFVRLLGLGSSAYLAKSALVQNFERRSAPACPSMPGLNLLHFS